MDMNIIEERLLNLPVEIKELKFEILEASLTADKLDLDVKNKEMNALDIVISENRASNDKGRIIEKNKILSADEEYTAYVDDLRNHRESIRREQINLSYLEECLRSYHSIVLLGRGD